MRGPTAPARDFRARHAQPPMTTARSICRRLLAHPGITTLTIVTLAVGISANLAMFTVVNAVLLRPLPVPDSDRLVILEHVAPGLTQLPSLPMSDALYFLYREESRTLDDVALFENRPVSFTDPDNPIRVPSASVTTSFFDLVGVPPLLGRSFDAADEYIEDTSEAILSHGLWESRFGGDRRVLGQVVEIDGAPIEIIGIMPAGFNFPDEDTRLWLPLRPNPQQANLGAFRSNGIGRIAPEHTLEQVQAELAAMATNLVELFPEQGAAAVFTNAGFTPDIKPAREAMVGDLRATLWIVFGGASFLLLIACANVANLFLAQTETRYRELAIRIALGETRMGIMRTMITESLLLALAGGVTAIPLALAAVRLLVRFGPQDIPRLSEITADANVLWFGVVLSVIAGLLFGALPALKAGTIAASATLHEGARGTSTTRTRHRIRRTLVAVQIALALTLLIGSGLAVRSFQRIASVDPGFAPEGLLSLRLALPPQRYESHESRLLFHRQLLMRLAALPGAATAAAVSDLPFGGSLTGSAAQIEGQQYEDGDVPPVFMMKNISPGYFEALGIELIAGRDFERLDEDRTAPVVIVSESLARTHWPNENAIGKGILQGRQPGESNWFRIIGVVEDVHQRSLHETPPPVAYYPLAIPAVQEDGIEVRLGMSFIVQTNGTALAALARDAVRSIDPRLPISDVTTLETLVARANAQRMFIMVLLLITATLAVLLGTVGLYGVISYIVAQRYRDIAIRIALGAQYSEIRQMVLVEASWMALGGIALGLGAALMLTRRLQALLFETHPLDPLVFTAVSGLLLGTSLLATWLPARRAALIEPMQGLRAE